MSERVFAVASLYNQPELLPHFFEHYVRLGAHRVIVAVRTPARDATYGRAAAEAARFPGCQAAWHPSDRFADDDKAEVELRLLAAAGLEPDDYVMHLDLDEFQEYPAPVPEVVREMNAHDDWALRGWVVDRVADDGTLPPVRPGPPVWEQYPVACDLTGKLLRAWTQKIVLCRGRVRLQGGVRHDTCNAHYDRVPIGRSADYRVHHFKWTAGLAERLEERLRTAALSGQYRAECQRFLDHHKRHGGRIDLGDPALAARWLAPHAYPAGRRGPAVRLVVNRYADPDPARDAELRACWGRNRAHPLIGEVRALAGRPSFDDHFAAVNERTGPDDVNVVANADIYFDETLAAAVAAVRHDECFALSRWDDAAGDGAGVGAPGTGGAGPALYDRDDSQDAWVFRGPIRPVAARFPPGTLGCDNRLARLLADAGYRVTNPGRTVRARHLHRSGVRRYGTDAASRVPGAYLRLPPTDLYR